MTWDWQFYGDLDNVMGDVWGPSSVRVWACPVCGALVPEERRSLHERWHLLRGEEPNERDAA